MNSKNITLPERKALIFHLQRVGQSMLQMYLRRHLIRSFLVNYEERYSQQSWDNIRVWSTHSQLSSKTGFLFRSYCSTELAWLDVNYLCYLPFVICTALGSGDSRSRWKPSRITQDRRTAAASALIKTQYKAGLLQNWCLPEFLKQPST